MSVFRIDELARAAGLTARNVRAYQERGLLPPPRLRGRTGLYDESHLARLRLIGQLLGRGYTLAVIADLLSAWERGRDLGDLLGLEKVLTDPWSDELPAYLTDRELIEMFGLDPEADDLPGLLAEAQERGFLEREGDRYRVPSPQLLQIGADLAAAGIPLRDVFAMSDRLHEDLAVVARRFVRFAIDHGSQGPGRFLTRDDVPELAAFIQRLRPLAFSGVEVILARSMQNEMRGAVGDQIALEIRRAIQSAAPGEQAEPGG
ncbi:MerR family transcriptional regulator [Actinomadura yumaensis]|uniref:MerR family transcriptional regulator n=1 Tax=Actinomadura yumaensis TaxID=111807 RepID=A0ABW2CQ37_9ACTN